MKTLYLDVFSGISGDMFIAALIDLGVSAEELERELRKLGVSGYHIHTRRGQNAQIDGVKFDVHLEQKGGHSHSLEHEHGQGHNPEAHAQDHEHQHDHVHEHDHGNDDHHHHSHESGSSHTHSHSHAHEHEHDATRDFQQIRELIQGSALSEWVKQRSVAVFQRLAAAEGKIHGKPADQVHFHEVGAIDSIVDIVGTCIGLELLGKPRVVSGPVVDGTGWVHCAHGRFPIPAPATLEVLAARGVALSQCEEPHELVTPTGAALLAEFAESFGPLDGFVSSRIGYGLGTRLNKTRPNVLRAVLGEQTAAAHGTLGSQPSGMDWEIDTITVLETNIDDCTGEILGHFVERAMADGALDVFHAPIQMKKNRPGVLLTVLCPTGKADYFSQLILLETSAFGVRRTTAERRKLPRENRSIRTAYGEVNVKVGKWNGRILRITPEYESCKQVAAQAQVPIADVYRAVEQAAPALK